MDDIRSFVLFKKSYHCIYVSDANLLEQVQQSLETVSYCILEILLPNLLWKFYQFEKGEVNTFYNISEGIPSGILWLAEHTSHINSMLLMAPGTLVN